VGWDLKSVEEGVSDPMAAAEALRHATGLEDTFRATVEAADAASLAFAHAAAEPDDTAAQDRLTAARGPLADARAAALERVLQHSLPDGDAPAARWIRSQASRRVSGAGGAAEAESGLFARWQVLSGSVDQCMVDAPSPSSLAARAQRAHLVEEAWAPHRVEAARVASEVVRSRLGRARMAGVGPMELAGTSARASAATVAGMRGLAWDARPVLQRYLRARAEHLGAQPGPLPAGVRHQPLDVGENAKPWTFDEATDHLLRAFGEHAPELAAFARRALRSGWVDAPPKSRFPGTCMHWSSSRASRIHMVFDGSRDSVVTLAHELGHAFHADVLYRRGPTPLDLPVSVAETASLVAEGIARRSLGGDDEVLLLDAELAGATKWLLDAGQTLALEERMWHMRASGPLDDRLLGDAAVEVAEEWFGPLAHPNRTYWASQWMFFLPGHVALALPYQLAFGFASLLEPEALAEAWVPLLADTEDASLETLARRHLGVDLAEAATYGPVLEGLEAQVARFEALVL